MKPEILGKKHYRCSTIEEEMEVIILTCSSLMTRLFFLCLIFITSSCISEEERNIYLVQMEGKPVAFLKESDSTRC